MIAVVAEMIHTASLVHDDIIDESLLRRGNPSVFSVWGESCLAYFDFWDVDIDDLQALS